MFTMLLTHTLCGRLTLLSPLIMTKRTVLWSLLEFVNLLSTTLAYNSRLASENMCIVFTQISAPYCAIHCIFICLFSYCIDCLYQASNIQQYLTVHMVYAYICLHEIITLIFHGVLFFFISARTCVHILNITT